MLILVFLPFHSFAFIDVVILVLLRLLINMTRIFYFRINFRHTLDHFYLVFIDASKLGRAILVIVLRYPLQPSPSQKCRRARIFMVKIKTGFLPKVADLVRSKTINAAAASL